jgi:hypothetical protein
MYYIPDRDRTLTEESFDDDSAARWYVGASDRHRLVPEGRACEAIQPCKRFQIPWAPPIATCYVWTDGSFWASTGAGWLVTTDSFGLPPSVIQGGKALGAQCTAFDCHPDGNATVGHRACSPPL